MEYSDDKDLLTTNRPLQFLFPKLVRESYSITPGEESAMHSYEAALPAINHYFEGSKAPLYRFLKRSMDIVLSATLVILCAPLFLVIAVLIKATSKGAVFYKQKRLGQNGKEFFCLKFRTMVADADVQLKQCEKLQAQFEDSYKIKDDPRVTKVGKYLRSSSLDELPQFFNVLRSELTMIGPRPIVPPELAKYGIYGEKLLSVKPGLGGVWQACGRSETSYEERIEMDMMYVDTCCILLDIKLLMMTGLAVLRRSGAC